MLTQRHTFFSLRCLTKTELSSPEDERICRPTLCRRITEVQLRARTQGEGANCREPTGGKHSRAAEHLEDSLGSVLIGGIHVRWCFLQQNVCLGADITLLYLLFPAPLWLLWCFCCCCFAFYLSCAFFSYNLRKQDQNQKLLISEAQKVNQRSVVSIAWAENSSFHNNDKIINE